MITYLLIVVTAVLSFLSFSDNSSFEKLVFIPHRIKENSSEWFRFISHGFVHGDLSHLAFNMLTLYFFGPIVENKIMSSTEFLLFYLLSIATASAVTYKKKKNDPNYIACGASGAISALLFVLVFYEPWSKLYLYFAIPIYYILFAIGYLIYSWYMDRRGKGNIAHDIHFYGALVGVTYVLLVHPESLNIFLRKIQMLPW